MPFPSRTPSRMFRMRLLLTGADFSSLLRTGTVAGTLVGAGALGCLAPAWAADEPSSETSWFSTPAPTTGTAASVAPAAPPVAAPAVSVPAASTPTALPKKARAKPHVRKAKAPRPVRISAAASPLAATTSTASPVLTPVVSGQPAAVQPAADPSPSPLPSRKGGKVRRTGKRLESTSPETVTITGSMLKMSKRSNPNPVQVITSKDIMRTGIPTLGEFLAREPSISGGQNNTDTNGGGGVSCTDLRNMGTERVLVLIDGKRTTMDAAAACVDMNTIPIQLVQTIDIQKDGTSALYGADAVSGVLNIKLRHDVNDGGVFLRGGITGHGDGRTGMLSAYKGVNFDEGRGNITVFGSYNTESGIKQKDRSWADPVQVNLGRPAVFGSAYAPKPRWVNEDGKLLNGPPQRFDYAKDTYLTNDLHTGTLYGDAHYDFSKHFTLYSNVLYSHRNSLSQMAAEPFYGSIPPSSLPSNLTVPGDYPGNPYGQDATMATRRFTEFGPRRTEDATDTYTAKGGLSGEIIQKWMYDASFTYGVNQDTMHQLNIGNYQSLLNGYGLQQLDPGNPDSALGYNPTLCPSTGCASPFKPLDKNAAAYANQNINQHAKYQLRDWNLRFHKDEVAVGPWEHGGAFGLAFGMEHRGEQLTLVPDGSVQNGTSMTNPKSRTAGGFNSTEGYLEGNFNLLHDAVAAKDLTINGQGRVSGYNTFGIAKNWKGGINWAPTRDIRFRGTLGTSFRQPNVYNLYGGQELSFDVADDPCSNPANAAIANRCGKAAGVQESGSGQLPVIYGGNPKVKPETSRTYTFGTVITPRWIPRLTAEIEFWHTSIQKMIGSAPTQYVLDSCYQTGNFCNQIQRNAQGSISRVYNPTTNLGGMHTSGIDYNLDYSYPLTSRDVVSLHNQIQQLVSYKIQNGPNVPYSNYKGRLLYQGNSAGSYPVLRDYATVTYRHDRFSINYMMQYIDGMRWSTGSNDVKKSASVPRNSTPGMFMQDVTLNYRLNRWNFEGGIDNITNKRPPYIPNGVNNSNGGAYGSFFMGRYFFLQASATF